jgi:hypothetical protein
VLNDGSPKRDDDDDDDDDNIIIIITIIIKEHWYDHAPKLVETRLEEATILWKQKVQTDITIPNHKSDMIIRYNEKRTYILTDAAISGDRNVVTKVAENIPKYKDLTIEIQRLWHVKARVMPVIRGTTGTRSKSFR